MVNMDVLFESLKAMSVFCYDNPVPVLPVVVLCELSHYIYIVSQAFSIEEVLKQALIK